MTEIHTPMNDALSPDFKSQLDPYFRVDWSDRTEKQKRKGRAEYIAEGQKRKEQYDKRDNGNR